LLQLSPGLVQTGAGENGVLSNGGGAFTDISRNQVNNHNTNNNGIAVSGHSRINIIPPVSESVSDEPPSKRQKDAHSKVAIAGENRDQRDMYNYKSRAITFSVTPVPANENPIAWVLGAIDGVVQDLLSGIPDSDFVLFNIKNRNSPEKEIDISLRQRDQISPDIIFGEIEKVIQSNEKFGLDEITITRHHVANNKGGHVDKKKFALLDSNMYALHKRSCIRIINDGNDCLAHALVVAIARIESSKKAAILRESKNKRQEAADKLCRDANVDLSNGGGRLELEKIQEFLHGYKISVYADGEGRELFYIGTGTGEMGNINLHLENNHYNVITNTKAYFACRYYCEACYSRCDTLNHRCEKSCSRCKHNPICKDEQKIACGDCNRLFNGLQCFQNHKINAPNQKDTACDIQKACTICGTFYMVNGKNQRNHICNERFCQYCSKFVPPDHQCYIKTAEITDEKEYNNSIEKTQFIFYDLETKQTKFDEHTGYVHEANLCVIETACHLCMNEQDLNKECSKCGQRSHTFSGENCIGEFLDYMTTKHSTKNFKKIICVAHNGKSYDTVLVCKYIMTKRHCIPELICVGSKILCMSVAAGRVKFIDSVNFMQMKLKDLPKAFGLNSAIKKGCFPHLFNTDENQNYVGPLPDLKYFLLDTMSTKEKSEIELWHAEMVASNSIFDFQKEFIDYCKMDVTILRMACIEFMKTFQCMVNVQPFVEAITIAGACNLAYRRNFLPADTVGLIPKQGYRRVDTQSDIALQWLVWLEYSMQTEIQHAGRGREKILFGNVRVDGYLEKDGEKIVYEFHGCYFHGCEICMGNQEYTSHGSNSEIRTATLRRLQTESKMKKLKDAGYKVIQMWECTFRKQLESNIEMKEYVTTHPLIPKSKLQVRDAFFGGRTNAIKLHHKVEEGEKMLYYDVCSLYPFINKYKKYPVGHPKVYVGNECPKLENIEGFIHCKILPPKRLFHPVLPAKIQNKLMFVLCVTCAENLNNSECNHNDNQRMLLGTWVSDEVKKAVQMGYKIIEILEVWQYETLTFDPRTNQEGLLSSYINKFLKLKVEASGWPSCVDQTDENSKRLYIADFYARENVQLDYDKIAKNPGIRSVSKICLNCLWGFFGMKPNKTQTTIVSSSRALFDIISKAGVVVVNLVPVNDKKMIVFTKMTEESYMPNKKTNVAIAAYTTAQARLHLYTYLEILNKKVTYFDTDSLIFCVKDDDPEKPKTGVFLGDLTDELETYGKGSYIQEFVSGGPKNYAFSVKTPGSDTLKYSIKVKGMTINSSNDHVLCFNTLKRMVCNNDGPVDISYKHTIHRNKQFCIYTKQMDKKYQVVYTKRRIIEGTFDTVPYGYV
jgi:hypothetical protein